MSSVVQKIKPKQPQNHPPGPFGHWLMGVMPKFQADSIQAMNNMAAEYGDAIRFHAIGPFYGYIFFHPDHNKHILQDNNKNYTKIPHPSLVTLQPVIGNGLLTSDGEFWRQQRRLAQPAFHKRRLASFAETMTACTERMLARWQPLIDSGEPFDLAHEMMELTLEIVGHTLFSIDITQEAETVGEAFTEVSEYISMLTRRPFSDILVNLPFTPQHRTVKQFTQRLDEVVNQIIEQRRQTPADQMPDDLLTMLMEAEDIDTGQRMDDRQLRDEVMTIMLAGHETTALALTWAFYLLAEHPEVYNRLQEEVDRVLNGRLPTFADLPELTYTTMVIEETLRLYPPAYAIARFGQGPDQVSGYDLPKNAVVTLSPFLTHRHPDFWEEPERFDPERFTPERKAERHRFAYIPFGAGPRLCIGNNFAMTEAILLLATISQQTGLTLTHRHPVEMDPLITLRPKYGLEVTAHQKQAAAVP